MNPVNRREVRVKCQVKGCPNIPAFAFSRSPEPGNTPIICAACAKEIGKLMGLVEPVPVTKKVVKETPHPSAELTPSPRGEGKKKGNAKGKKEK